MRTALTGVEYFAGPLLVLGLLGLLILVLRWAFARGGSLVRRTDTTPAPTDAFGLLTDVHTTPRYADARQLVEQLANARIRATAARTTQGWTVYVWPADVTTAQTIIRNNTPPGQVQ